MKLWSETPRTSRPSLGPWRTWRRDFRLDLERDVQVEIVPGPSFEAPTSRRLQGGEDDFDLHIALEVEPEVLDAMFAKGKAEGREVRGVSDHSFIARSISATQWLRDRTHCQGPGA